MSDRVRITFEIPKTLLEFVDNEVRKKSTEIMKCNRSLFLRQLIIEARDKAKEGKEYIKWNLPKDSNDYKNGYDDLLNLSGYNKTKE